MQQNPTKEWLSPRYSPSPLHASNNRNNEIPPHQPGKPRIAATLDIRPLRTWPTLPTTHHHERPPLDANPPRPGLPTAHTCPHPRHIGSTPNQTPRGANTRHWTPISGCLSYHIVQIKHSSPIFYLTIHYLKLSTLCAHSTICTLC